MTCPKCCGRIVLERLVGANLLTCINCGWSREVIEEKLKAITGVPIKKYVLKHVL